MCKVYKSIGKDNLHQRRIHLPSQKSIVIQKRSHKNNNIQFISNHQVVTLTKTLYLVWAEIKTRRTKQNSLLDIQVHFDFDIY